MKTTRRSWSAVLLVACLTLGAATASHAQEPAPYQPPRLAEPNAWSIILVPDTQTYVMFGRNQGIFELMTAWIAENLQTLRVLTVMHVGDLVEQNNVSKTDGVHLNQTSAEQWTAIWEKLIYPSDNIRLVLCGHIAGIKDPRENVGFRTGPFNQFLFELGE